MRISVCTDMLYAGMPTQDAMPLVKAVGADAVEFWGVQGKDLSAIAAAGRALGLPIAAICAPQQPAMIAPDGSAGYPEELKRMADACDLLGCRTLIAISGVPDWGWTPAAMRDRLRATVEATVPVLEALDLTLLLEPLNASEMHFMRSSRDAFDLARLAGSPRVRVLYDLYHMQYMEGNLLNTLIENLPLVGHLHAADLPGRLAPGKGEIHFPNIVRALDDAGYAGYLGLEYQPGADRDAELAATIALLR